MKTLKAITESVDKWSGIVSLKTADYGGNNCALCALYMPSGCGGCLVASITGVVGCGQTPYAEWRGAHNRMLYQRKHPQFKTYGRLKIGAALTSALLLTTGLYIVDVLTHRYAMQEFFFLQLLANYYATSKRLLEPYALDVAATRENVLLVASSELLYNATSV